MPQSEARGKALRIFQRYQGLVGLALLLVVAAFISKEFFSGANFVNVLKQLAIPGTLAVGMTFVILTGGIDLSAGSHLALLNVVIATWLRSGTGLGATTAYVLLLGTLIGALIGWLVGATRLQPFVVTLSAMVTLRGISFIYSNGAFVSGFGDSLRVLDRPVLGLPLSGWVLVAVTLAAWVLLSRTAFGRRTYALGGNERAARLSGVPVDRVRIGAYALNGLCIAVAAILFTARTNSGQPSAGMGYELDAIAAVVVGGSSLVGGVGSVLGTFVGALFMGCVNTLIQLKGVDFYVGMGWKGLIILLAVYLQNLGRGEQR